MIAIVLGAALGFALGAAWFASLRMNTDLYLAAGPAWRAIVLHVARLVVIGVAFTLLAMQGATALLAALAGFLAARAVAFRRGRIGAG